MADIILLILISCLLMIIVGVMIFIGFEIHNEEEKKRRLNEIELYNKIYSTMENYEDCLNNFISNKVDEYIIIHSDKFDDYITEKTQKEMIININKEVLECMSPILLSQLKIVYNSNHLNEIINKKISLLIIAKVVESNGIINKK